MFVWTTQLPFFPIRVKATQERPAEPSAPAPGEPQAPPRPDSTTSSS